ncbi:MAG: DUF72 domain-containing protein, partial [Candidatus Binatia bacterium]
TKRGKQRADPLEFYANYFNAVEINATFYRPASAAMARAWVDKTPPDFVFTVKAWQKFTHSTKLGDGASGAAERWAPFDRADVEYFSAGIAPLVEAGRLGGLLFQYPAGFVRNPENGERLEAALAAFNFCPKVVELRHRSWSDQRAETDALLARFRSSWAFIDEPKFATSVRQELTADDDISYLRLHGRNTQKWWRHENSWERYDYFYPAENIHRLADRLRQLANKSPQTKFYVFFNNHARGQAVANGLMLQAALTSGARAKAPRSMMDAFPELGDFAVVSDEAGEPRRS